MTSIVYEKANFAFNFVLDDDFIDECDLFVACMVLQKQIELIDGKKENIIVPTVAMNKIREMEQAGI
jgi:hypothetical protein